MSKIIFTEEGSKPPAPSVGQVSLYVKTDEIVYIQDSAGTETPLGSAAAITALTGDVSAVGPGSAVATVNSVGGESASNIASSVVATQNATPLDIDSTIVERDGSGNFAANIITANLNGNATTSTSSTSFTGSLAGDVTGTQSSTVVVTVGGSTAVNIHSAELAANAATPANTASTIVERDASGNFVANIVTANLTGNVTGNVSGSSGSFTGSLAGDVTGTQSTTSISSTTITGKLLTGYTTGTNTPLVSTNSILTAFENLQAQIGATSGSAITSLTGDVSASGPGSAIATVNSVGGQTASDIAAATITVDAATNANTINTLVKRDGSGNFNAGVITANLIGNVTGNVSGSSGSFTGSLSGDITGTQTTTLISKIDGTTVSGTTGSGNVVFSASPTFTGTINGASEVLTGTISASNLSGTNTGDQTITLTGDVSGSGTGSFATTVNSVGGSTAANIHSAELLANAATNINTPSAIVKRDASGNFNAGTITATLAGNATNITATSNNTLTTLPNLVLPTTQLSGQVTLAQLPTIASDTLLGNNTAGSTTPSTLTVAQVNAILPIFTNTLNGLAPSSGGGTNNYLRADGTWAPPPGATSGTVTSVAVTTPSWLTVSGSPITSSGTIAITGTSEPANEFLASPNGSAGAMTPRLIAPADIPTLNQNTTGTASNITATSNSTLTTLPNLTSATSLAINGTQVGGFTQGSIPFAGVTGTLIQDNANLYWNDTTINLGLGTIPSTNIALDLVNTTAASKAIQTTSYGAGSSIPFRGRFARGTLATPTAAQSGDNLSVLSGRGYGSSQFAAASTGTVNIVAGETFTNASNATYIQFQTTNTGSVTLNEAMRVSPAGNLLIGTTADSGTQKLQVNGNSNVGTVTAGTWNGTDISIAFGGTGVSTTPTNGQLLIGNGSGYTVATLTAGTGISINNTAGAITITANATTSTITRTSAYTILSTDSVIFCDTSGGAFTLTLPSPSGLAGKMYKVIDSTGFFNTNNLTLARSASEKIEGLATSKILQTAWGWFNITTDGVNWYVG